MKIYTTTAPETDDVGLADNDIDGFLKSLTQSVCRESTQNSNDEALERPVRVGFDLESVETASVPGIAQYRKVLESCLADASKGGDKKGTEFFSNAIKVVSRPTIPVFRISDTGTGGAGGPFRKGGKFYTLVVSTGRTDKDNVFSAGSFGIGKNAAIAGSELRLVFYSSVFGNNPDTDFHCMGKSVLTSWRNDQDENMSHKIFFTDDSEHFKPQTSQEGLPGWLTKSEQGLQVAIVAPRIEIREHWQASFIASVLANFFSAIYAEDIEFELGGGAELINRSTMLDYFQREDVQAAALESGLSEQLEWAEVCTRALTANDFVSERFSIPNLGDFEVLIHVAEDLPKKVCIVRNGMFITDTLKNFGKDLKRFPSTKDFIALVRPKSVDDSSSELLKRMENPEHNELTTGYIADENEVKTLQRAVERLEKEVRTVIKQHAKMEIVESKSIDELRGFFASPGQETSGGGNKEEDPTRIMVSDPNTKQPPPKFQQRGSGSGGKGKKANGVKTKTKRPGPGGAASGSYKPLQARLYAVKASAKRWRIEIAAPPSTATHCEIWPQATSRGSDTQSLKVLSCSLSGAVVSSDQLSVKLPIGGAPISFDLVLEADAAVIDLRPVVKI